MPNTTPVYNVNVTQAARSYIDEALSASPYRSAYGVRQDKASRDIEKNILGLVGTRSNITIKCDGCNSNYTSSTATNEITLLDENVLALSYLQAANGSDELWGVCISCEYRRWCSGCETLFPATQRPRPITQNSETMLCVPCMDTHLMQENMGRCESCHSHFSLDVLTTAPNSQALPSLYCTSCARERIVMPYNANPLEFVKFMGDPKDKLFYGVELEVENSGDDFYDVALNTYQSVSDFAILKHDGSLNNGFEVVSAPMSMDVHKSEIWDRFFEKGGGRKNLKSAKTDTCGMHVHISRNGLSTMTVGKVLQFIHSSKNKEFITLIAGRPHNHYCTFGNDHKAVEALRRKLGGEYDRERYNAVNLQNEHTMEIRIFKGTLSRKMFLKNLEFCESIVKFAQNHSMGESESYKLYVYWVMSNRKTYPVLAQWLKKFWLVNKEFVANFKNAYTVERSYVGKELKTKFDSIKRKKERESKARQDARLAAQADMNLRQARAEADSLIAQQQRAYVARITNTPPRVRGLSWGEYTDDEGNVTRLDSPYREVYNDGRVLRQGQITYSDEPDLVSEGVRDYYQGLRIRG